MTVNFTVLGEPQGKARPRVVSLYGKTWSYTPKGTINYEEWVRQFYRGPMFEGAVCMKIICFTEPPKSAPKAKRQSMLSGEIRPTKKPDLDNVIKIVCDALNKVAYQDDKQVVKVLAERWFSDRPRIEVEINDNLGRENDD